MPAPTEFRLTKKSGATITFSPAFSGGTVYVVTRWPDGDAVTAAVPTVLARKMWKSEVRYGAKAEALPAAAYPSARTTEDDFEDRSSDGPGCPTCGCPEYHDGEECPTAARLGLEVR